MQGLMFYTLLALMAVNESGWHTYKYGLPAA